MQIVKTWQSKEGHQLILSSQSKANKGESNLICKKSLFRCKHIYLIRLQTLAVASIIQWIREDRILYSQDGKIVPNRQYILSNSDNALHWYLHIHWYFVLKNTPFWNSVPSQIRQFLGQTRHPQGLQSLQSWSGLLTRPVFAPLFASRSKSFRTSIK